MSPHRLRVWLAFVLLVLVGLLFFFLKPEPESQRDAAVARGATTSDGLSSRAVEREISPAGVKADANAELSKLESGVPAADGFVEVRVLASGAAVPRARVTLHFRGATDPQTLRSSWLRAGGGMTDDKGVLRLRVGAGRFHVIAASEGFAAASGDFVRPPGEKLRRITLTLVAGTELAGLTRVKGSQEPVPFAQLTIFPVPVLSPDNPGDVPDADRSFGTSDARGRFHFHGLAPGRYRLEATAPSFGRAVIRSVVLPHAGILQVELTGASFIEGFVERADGTQAGGAQVIARGSEEPFISTAGSSGSFSLGVDPGVYRLSAKLGAETGTFATTVTVAAGATSQHLRIRLGRAARLSGNVTEGQDHRAVAGVQIVVSPHWAVGDSGRAVTNSDGRYVVEGLTEETYDVGFLAPGHPEKYVLGVALLAGEDFVLDAQLEAGGVLEGTVRTRSGKPVNGALVSADVFGVTPPQAATDAEGHYRMSGLPVGKVFLRATRAGVNSGTGKAADVLEGEATRLDLELADVADLSGVVREKSGAALTESAIVSANCEGDSEEVNTPTDSSGHYRLTVNAGVCKLLAYPNEAGAWRRYSGRTSVTVSAGESRTFDLELADDGNRGVHGVVSEADGAPSSNAQLQLMVGKTVRLRTVTNADGTFDFWKQKDEESFVGATVLAESWGRTGRGVAIPGRDLQITLQPATHLTGRILSRSAVTEFTLTVRSLSSDGMVQEISEEGSRFSGASYAIEAPSHVRVEARTPDGRVGHAEAHLTPGGHATLDIQVTAPPNAKAPPPRQLRAGTAPPSRGQRS